MENVVEGERGRRRRRGKEQVASVLHKKERPQ